MSNKLVAELALDAFDSVMSFQVGRLEKALDECRMFDQKYAIIVEFCTNNCYDGMSELEYQRIFNAMLCLIAENVGQVIRYMVR